MATTKKSVTFSHPLVTKTHYIPASSSEYCKSVWEQQARDRVRFMKRIEELGTILNPALLNKIRKGSTEIYNVNTGSTTKSTH